MTNIEALKQKILSLAIQGKLVPQNPSDEPASVLLEKIKSEKAELVKQGKIKKDKQESYIFRGDDNKYYEKIGSEIKDITDEIPFNIPNNWQWVRLPVICSLFKGKEVQNVKLPYLDVKYLRGSKKQELVTKGCLLKKDDFVILVDGENSGEVFKIKEEGIMGSTFRQLLISSGINENYILYFLKYYQTLLRENKRGAAIPHLDKHIFGNLLFGLPPLKEQILIVSNIEKIFNQIEVVKTNQEELSKLKDGLKNKILDLAIQGKLVEQDPNDESASVLLEKIKAEKIELVKQGKIKKDKQESYIFKGPDNRHYEKIGSETKDITDEIPFEIPNSWQWVRLGNIMEIARGSSPRPIQNYLTTDENGINWIKIGDTDKGGKYINSTREKIKPEGLKKTRMVHKGDFLLTNSMSFGRPYILNIDGCIHDGWLVISDTFNSYFIDFLYYLLSSSFAYKQFCGKVSGAVVSNLNSDKVSSSIFPLPPLSEQRRIVEKIELFVKIIKKI